MKLLSAVMITYQKGDYNDGIFYLLKKKKELSVEDLKWNRLWDLWTEWKVISPYAELMTYESEVNNGGHFQFFDNVSRTSDLPETISALYGILNGVLKGNLEQAYKAYSDSDEDDDDETFDEILDECDNTFYENESEVEQILKEYAKTIEL